MAQETGDAQRSHRRQAKKIATGEAQFGQMQTEKVVPHVAGPLVERQFLNDDIVLRALPSRDDSQFSPGCLRLGTAFRSGRA